jgi:hypothetical protein
MGSAACTGLLNCVVIVIEGMTENDERGKMWMKVNVVCLKVLFQICLEELRKTTKSLRIAELWAEN